MSQARPLPPFEAVSFDCYGTLIDWEAGLRAALVDAWPDLDAAALDAFVAARGDEEWRLISGLDECVPYRELLAESVRAAAARLEIDADDERAARVAGSVGDWPPYPDAARALARLSGRYRLAIASNVDRVDLERSLSLLGAPKMHTVTVDDVQCYKPEPDHLMALVHELGLDESELLHVSAYPEYDLETAFDLGIPCAYVDRRGVPLDDAIEVVLSVPDMSALANRLLAAGRRGAPRRGGPRRRATPRDPR